MSDDSNDMMRVQIRLYREEDPRLFALLSALSPTVRARRIRQLLRNALLAEQGVSHEAIAKGNGRDVPSEPKAPTAGKTTAVPPPALVDDSFEQSDFNGQVTIMPGTHFAPKLLRAGNER